MEVCSVFIKSITSECGFQEPGWLATWLNPLSDMHIRQMPTDKKGEGLYDELTTFPDS
jgi:hypothetical protein